MIEKVECLSLKAKLYVFPQGKPLRQIKIGPREIGAAQRVPSEIAELAILRVIFAGASSCARVHRRDERVRIEPLHCPRRRHTRNWLMLIKRNTSDNARKLRAAPLHNAVAVRRVRCTQHRKRHAAVPERRSRDLPPITPRPRRSAPRFERQLVNVLRGEIAADIVIARTVLPPQFSRQGREDSS